MSNHVEQKCALPSLVVTGILFFRRTVGGTGAQLPRERLPADRAGERCKALILPLHTAGLHIHPATNAGPSLDIPGFVIPCYLPRSGQGERVK